MKELVTKFGGYLLFKTKHVHSIDEGAILVLEKLKNKEALEIFKQMVIAQGVAEDTANELCSRNYSAVFVKKSRFETLIKTIKAGFIKSIDALVLGLTASKLGAGREKSSKYNSKLTFSKIKLKDFI